MWDCVCSPWDAARTPSFCNERWRACTVGDFTMILMFLQLSNFHDLEIKNRILQGNEVYHMLSWGLVFVLFVYMAISYALWECSMFKATVN